MNIDDIEGSEDSAWKTRLLREPGIKISVRNESFFTYHIHAQNSNVIKYKSI